VVIRPLRRDDSIEELTNLLHRAYAALGEKGLNYTAVDQSPETTRKRVENRRCLIALDGARIVGTLLVNSEVPNILGACFGNPKAASVHQFAVDPAYQCRGLGSQLLAEAESWARSIGFAEMALDTAESAAQLIAYYVRRGYRSVGSVQWNGKVYRSLIMSKKLAHAAWRGARANEAAGPALRRTLE